MMAGLHDKRALSIKSADITTRDRRGTYADERGNIVKNRPKMARSA
jgi:hypothetical protein